MHWRLLIVAALGGCVFDDHRAEELCPEAGACADEQVCVRGLCRPPGLVEDAVVGRPPVDTTPRFDSTIVDAATQTRDAAHDAAQDAHLPPVDAVVPEPDAAVAPPTPDAEVVPPPPPDAAPPTAPPPPVGPILGLPGCDPALWCTYAEADAVVMPAVPDANFGGAEHPLGVSRRREVDAVALLRFSLRPLVGRRVAQVHLLVDVEFSSPGGRGEGSEPDLEVAMVVGFWQEHTVTWNRQPVAVGNDLDVVIRTNFSGPVAWDITALFPGMVVPDELSLRIREDGTGSYLFVNRENGADGDPGWPARLQIRLVD